MAEETKDNVKQIYNRLYEKYKDDPEELKKRLNEQVAFLEQFKDRVEIRTRYKTWKEKKLPVWLLQAINESNIRSGKNLINILTYLLNNTIPFEKSIYLSSKYRIDQEVINGKKRELVLIEINFKDMAKTCGISVGMAKKFITTFNKMTPPILIKKSKMGPNRNFLYSIGWWKGVYKEDEGSFMSRVFWLKKSTHNKVMREFKLL